MDCLEGMKLIPDNSIDMILCDLPYGTTACKWDTVIPLEPLWEQYKRIIKDNGAIVLTGREPFTSALVMSNLKQYKHKWVWNKKQSGSFANAKYMPLQIEEDIVVFANGKVNYFPIMRKGKMRKKGGSNKQIQSMSKFIRPDYYKYSDEYYPTNILDEFPNCSNKKGREHPTQKPVELMRWCIKQAGDVKTLLDPFMGSGTTLRAAKDLGLKAIGIEISKAYCDIAIERLRQRSLFSLPELQEAA